MRKSVFLVMTGMISLMFILTGCSQPQEDNEQQTKSVADNISEVFAQAPEGKKIVTDYHQFVKPRESQEYNFETDYQYYVKSTWGAAKVGDSYYNDDKGLIMVLDKSSHAYNLLCAKPDCSHSNSSCGAVIPSNLGISYYNGSLYSICDPENIENAEEGIKKFSIIKTSLSGENKDKVKDIMQVAKTDLNISQGTYGMDIRYIQHRGYMYYVYTAGNIVEEDEFYMNGSNCLYRVSLEKDGKPECILPLEKNCNSSFLHMTAQGSYIYFVMADKEGFGELYRYNTESDVVEKINIGIIAAETYAVMREKILYKKVYDSKQLYLYDPITNTEELFVDMTDMAEGDSWDIRCDNDSVYVYYTNTDIGEAFFAVLDMEGKYRGKLILSNQLEKGHTIGLDFAVFDTDFIVCHIYENDEFLYFNKSEIK